MTNLKELYQWLSENRQPQRAYCFNPKHGDANNVAQGNMNDGTPAAQLETTQKQIQKLLNWAIGEGVLSDL